MSIKIKKQEELVPCGKLKCGDILFKTNPLEPFINDCDRCKYFYTTPLFHPSGKCTYSGGVICGFGNSCKNFVISDMCKELYGDIDNKHWK